MDSGGGKPTLVDNSHILSKITKDKNNKLTIASWNIKTLLDLKHKSSTNIPRRTAVIARELKRYNIDIASLQETHLMNCGQLEEENAGYDIPTCGLDVRTTVQTITELQFVCAPNF